MMQIEIMSFVLSLAAAFLLGSGFSLWYLIRS